MECIRMRWDFSDMDVSDQWHGFASRMKESQIIVLEAERCHRLFQKDVTKHAYVYVYTKHVSLLLDLLLLYDFCFILLLFVVAQANSSVPNNQNSRCRELPYSISMAGLLVDPFIALFEIVNQPAL